MNKETYEALKRIIEFVRGNDKELKKIDIMRVAGWIDEVEKDYCDVCGELNHRCEPPEEEAVNTKTQISDAKWGKK